MSMAIPKVTCDRCGAVNRPTSSRCRECQAGLEMVRKDSAG